MVYIMFSIVLAASHSMVTITGENALDRGERSSNQTSGSPFPYEEVRSLTLNNPVEIIRVDALGDTTGRTYQFDVPIHLTDTSNVKSIWKYQSCYRLL